MFMSYSFASTSLQLESATPENPITGIDLSSSIVDEMYLTKDIIVDFDGRIPVDWTLNTHLHATFNGNAHAGNVDYTEEIVQKVKIKKRTRGDFAWKTFKEVEIRTKEDFNIDIYDYYNPTDRHIDYAYVAVIGGAESNTISTTVYSSFDSYFICEKDMCYPIILDTTNQLTLNRQTTTVQPINRRYPITVVNGSTKYYSGSLTGTFIEQKDSGYDVQSGWKYRNIIDDFLSNGKPKILRDPEGNRWMISVTDHIQRNMNGHYQNVSQTFSWVECGDVNSIGDLYDNGFIDTEIDRG